MRFIPSTSAREQAQNLLRRMSLGEKVAQLSGSGGFAVLIRLGIHVFLLKRFPHVYAGGNRRLGIPRLSFTDGPRGVTVGRGTTLPVAMARGATFDPGLERRVGEMLALEAQACGANYFAGICVNLLRHPAWGRAQETFGEDPFHVGAMAAALVEGVQSHRVMACVKHFALNSIENSRFFVDVIVQPRALHEVFLHAFRSAVDAGAASFMSAYNKVNGEYAGQSHALLDEILRKRWGFQGFTSSDWVWGVHEAVAAIHAGLDLEMPYARRYGRRLVKAIRRGEVPMARIDECVLRGLSTRLDFEARPGPSAPAASILARPRHLALAQEVAEKGMVLLKNEQSALPLEGLSRIAVIGSLAKEPNLGDHGSSRTKPSFSISILDGMRERFGAAAVSYDDGNNHRRVAGAVKDAQAVVIVAGLGPRDEGENLTSNHAPGSRMRKGGGGDRENLSLSPSQREMIRCVSAAHPRVVVVLIGGSALFTDPWDERVSSILMAWYPGMMGGRAVARILAGDVNPSGKLPFAWPSYRNRLPPFDSGTPSVEYGLFHGYTWFDRQGEEPAWPFGFGLSYTRFVIGKASCRCDEDGVTIRVNVTNAGPRSGREVVQCYAGPSRPKSDDFKKRLRAFSSVELAPGESREVGMVFPLRDLTRLESADGTWRLDAGGFRLWVGSSSRETDCQETHFEVKRGMRWEETMGVWIRRDRE
jgi:beta-glucosidase